VTPRFHGSQTCRRRLRDVLVLLACWLLPVWAAMAAPSDADQVIVPAATPAKAPAAAGAPGAGAFTLATIVLLAGAGAWLLWRGRGRGLPSFGRGEKQLNVEETRSLGGRQFLVVASYRDQKFLLGVCPGRIEMLAPLDGSRPPANRPPSS
jgi:flagellar protein FliO/FliZ